MAKKRPRNRSAGAVSQPTSQQLSPGPIAHIAAANQGQPSVVMQVGQVTQTHFTGPLPHPDIFRQYGDIIPGAPERILQVFEEDSRHSRDIQIAALDAQKSDNRRVHWMAFCLIGGGYILSALFAWMGKDWLAGVILATTLTGTITGFLQGRATEKQEPKKSQG